MCGIAGFLTRNESEDARATACRMANAIAHRGPDGSGVWTDRAVGVALAHRRLAILDLTASGDQPMVSHDGRYVIVFNGEIYNFDEIRTELEKSGASPAWKGTSDTEVLLAAIVAWGLEGALTKSVGMFAFALWDRETRTLSLARDRLGEKPLYYGWVNGSFLFASELKAMAAYPGWQGEVNRDALTLLLRHSVISAPHCIYRGIYKLPPGTWLAVSERAVAAHDMPSPLVYWSARAVAEAGQRSLFKGSVEAAEDELQRLLSQAVRGQMVADVPLGAFLSGGVDSSSVVAMMQLQSSRPVRTFTIGFKEVGYNEAEHAHRVAQHLGTEHTELYLSSQDALDLIPHLPAIYDEPFADWSQIPTCLVARMAREHVTVCLSGDGGDELFGGYNRYLWVRNLWRTLGWMAPPVRAALAGVITTLSPTSWDVLFGALGRLLPAKWHHATPGDKLHKAAEILAKRSPEDIYLSLVSQWRSPGRVVPNSHEPSSALTDRHDWPSMPDFEHQMMYLDQVSYLPDDILTKVDRAAMAVSLETRVPFLDHRLIEFAWSIPLSMKIRHGQGKWLLRQVLYKHVPKRMLERPKMGFGVPIDQWLRGPLRSWAADLLDSSRVRREGYFDPGPIQQKWVEHQSGSRNWSAQLWSLLMFESWLECRGHSRLISPTAR